MTKTMTTTALVRVKTKNTKVITLAPDKNAAIKTKQHHQQQFEMSSNCNNANEKEKKDHNRNAYEKSKLFV